MNKPFLPSTCNIVFRVSIGVRKTQKQAAMVEAESVLIEILRSLVIE